MLRKAWRILSALLLIALGAGSVTGIEIGTVDTVLKGSVLAGQLVLFAAGVAGGVGALMGRRWAARAALVLAAALAYVAGVGPVAWGEVTWSRGLLDAIVGFGIGFLVYLGVRVRDGDE